MIVKTCECGCGEIPKKGCRFIYRHNRRGKSSWNKGKKMSEESKIKMSDAKTGKDHSIFINAGVKNRFQKDHKINNGRVQTEEHKKKNGDANRGNKSPNWLGGYSRSDYGKGFTKVLRERIRNKYNNKCIECGFFKNENNYKLDVHHIDYNKKNNSPSNLIPLCRSCHTKTNFSRLDWENYFKIRMGNV